MNAIDYFIGLAALMTAIGLAVVTAGAVAVRRFAVRMPPVPKIRPAVTVLKPLCGDEPLLMDALASICAQDYGPLQIVFGVQDANDPALLIVQRIRERFPDCDIALVTDATSHGPNRKISNLINMLSLARHDVLVISDSDVHAPPNYIERIVASLELPNVGLVTTVCLGLPTTAGTISRLGMTGISHSFLPGALLSRALGRRDCLGITMALRRDTLVRVGGLGSLVRHLADDNILGQRVHRLGLTVELAATVPMTAVPEVSLGALWQHELRWARTIRSLQPVLFASSTLQFPLFWAAIALALSGGSAWSVGLFAATWMIRAVAALWIDHTLLEQRRPPKVMGLIWLLPLRDLLSVSEVFVSYLGSRVVWRGQVMRADEGV